MIVGGVNPVHYGHIALIETGLKHVDKIDFMIGNKSIYVLPYNVREEALKSVIYNMGLEDRVSIPPLSNGTKTRLGEYETEKYSSLILGSDVLNHFHPDESIHRPQDKEFFLRFRKLIVLEREGVPVTEKVKEYVNSRWELEINPPLSAISAKAIQQSYIEGKDVCSMMPDYVWKQILPHAELFNLSKH